MYGEFWNVEYHSLSTFYSENVLRNLKLVYRSQYTWLDDREIGHLLNVCCGNIVSLLELAALNLGSSDSCEH